MRLRRKKIPKELQTPKAEALRDRAKKLSNEEVMEGLDQFASNIGAYVDGYRRTKAYDLLCEIQVTGLGIFTLSDVLLDRLENPLGIPQPEIKRARQVTGF